MDDRCWCAQRLQAHGATVQPRQEYETEFSHSVASNETFARQLASSIRQTTCPVDLSKLMGARTGSGLDHLDR